MANWNVITGGGGGMGLACARRLARRGPVLLAELDESRIAREELRARFPDYEVLEEGLTRTYQAHVRGFATVPIRTNRRN